MKIVLVEVIPEKSSMNIELAPPLGLGYIASVLESKGNKVTITEGIRYGDSLSKALHLIVSQNPDIVGFTATSQARFRAIELIRRTKKITRAITVAGGPHFHATYKEALENIQELDIVVKGEGERIMLSLIEAIEQKSDFKTISGVIYRGPEGEILENEDRPFLKDDIDTLPMPSFHLFNLRQYRGKLEGTNLPFLGVMSSRGCPNNCIFCANRVLNKNILRLRSPQKFVEEIEWIKSNYGYRAFDFLDDTITMSHSHLINICEEIIRKGLNIKWFARARVNTVNKEILTLMKRAGCSSIAFGIESGSQKMLGIINKGITVEQSEYAVLTAAQLGFLVSTYFIVSLPGETPEDINATFRLINKFKRYPNIKTYYSFAIIYPGTKLETIARQRNLLPDNFSWYKPYIFLKNKVVGNDPYLPCFEDRALTLEKIKAHILTLRTGPFDLRGAFARMVKINSFLQIKSIFGIILNYFREKRIQYKILR